jgi:hypothetical protein
MTVLTAAAETTVVELPYTVATCPGGDRTALFSVQSEEPVRLTPYGSLRTGKYRVTADMQERQDHTRSTTYTVETWTANGWTHVFQTGHMVTDPAGTPDSARTAALAAHRFLNHHDEGSRD